MREQPGVVKRKGSANYYLRVRIPKELEGHYGKHEIWRSLQTPDRKEATAKGRLERVKLDQEFEQARRTVTPTAIQELSDLQIDQLMLIYKAQILKGDEYIRETGRLRGGVASLYIKAMEAFGKKDAQRVAFGAPEGAVPELDQFLAEHGVKLAPGTESYTKVAYAFAKVGRLVADAISQRNEGEVVETPKAGVIALGSAVGQVKGVSLESLMEYWKGQKKRPARTHQSAKQVVTEFQNLHPNLMAPDIQKGQVVDYKDWLLKNSGSPETALKKLALLRTILQTAVDNNKLPSNPSDRVKVPMPKVRQKPRVPYELEDLKAIFKSEVFTSEVRPEGGKGEAAFWIPLIGLWTGARLEEIGKLLVTDVKTENSIHYFHITNDEGDIKTENSRRKIPVHMELIRYGLLDYVRAMAKKGERRLFPLVVSAEGRPTTASFSQWWGRYIRRVVKITDTRKVFHSFRHGFKDACRDSRIDKDIHDRLTGHGDGANEGDGYGGENFPLGPLDDAVARLRYQGLDLSHLYRKGD